MSLKSKKNGGPSKRKGGRRSTNTGRLYVEQVADLLLRRFQRWPWPWKTFWGLRTKAFQAFPMTWMQTGRHLRNIKLRAVPLQELCLGSTIQGSYVTNKPWTVPLRELCLGSTIQGSYATNEKKAVLPPMQSAAS
ncbi:uncharacterized protein LOC126986042 [Eriocheir sinensis]|uniref:uncharacterized protein LOC126986042 n=1 Tax=Eriocheir sinensis TaxID=95602 RepID=UPI0021C93374|nr:uncharacterized protein LOC126986042 [Eriocheir sinensis]